MMHNKGQGRTFRSMRSGNLPAKYEPGTLSPTGGFVRDLDNKRFLGVCSGLAKSTPIPALAWRLGFVLTSMLWGVGIPLYGLLWVLMGKPPRKPSHEPMPSELSAEEKEIWEAVKHDMASLELEND